MSRGDAQGSEMVKQTSPQKVLTGRRMKRSNFSASVGSKIHAPITGGAVPAAELGLCS